MMNLAFCNSVRIKQIRSKKEIHKRKMFPIKKIVLSAIKDWRIIGLVEKIASDLRIKHEKQIKTCFFVFRTKRKEIKRAEKI